MSLLADLKVLYHLLLKPVRGKDHAARMESFYAGQAEAYDGFRRRLLHGREILWAAIEIPQDGIWVDMGGGTGGNVEFFGESLSRLKKVYLVDISPSLLNVANQRIEQQGWKNVETVEADAITFTPPEGSCDVVTFSYSLTMIPDWYSAIDNAEAILKPNGQIGVVDFYVSRKHPTGGWVRHGMPTRSFWPLMFSSDNVFPSPDHAPFLHRHFDTMHFTENRARLPYLPFLRAPYYTFVGRRRPDNRGKSA
jgi:S-adenosylmethionine-diacylgycerolhomoserine-N-methlytransferase